MAQNGMCDGSGVRRTKCVTEKMGWRGEIMKKRMCTIWCYGFVKWKRTENLVSRWFFSINAWLPRKAKKILPQRLADWQASQKSHEPTLFFHGFCSRVSPDADAVLARYCRTKVYYTADLLQEVQHAAVVTAIFSMGFIAYHLFSMLSCSQWNM